MIILHVEDSTEWFENYVQPYLEKKNTVYHATSMSDAEKILSNTEIDYVILDLAIPSSDIETSPSASHGQALALHIRKEFPSIPILILTGQSSEEAAQELEEDDSFTHFWDGHNKNLVKTRKKSQLDLALDLVDEASELLSQLDNLELQYIDDKARDLTQIDKRIIRLFCKCNNAIGAEVNVLTDGLSDSNVITINLLDQQKNIIQRAIAKIDSAIKVEDEYSNYNSHVTRLLVGAFPVLLDQYYAGCGARKGAFYQLASEYNSNYFDVLMESDELATSLVERLKDQLSRWHTVRSQRVESIKNIRRLLCSDEKLDEFIDLLKDIDWEKFENIEVNSNWSIQHGDLHGANVLVSNENQPVIIDYGDINELPCSLDPITLELSPFFHPQLSDKYLPPDDLAENWYNDEYLAENSKSPNTLRALRNWANENAYLDREKLAVTYAYCIRQLTYPDTNKDLAQAFIKATIQRFE